MVNFENSRYSRELNQAVRKYSEDLLHIQNGEVVVIACDTKSDMSVVTTCAEVATQLGAEAIVAKYPMRPDVTMDPPKPVAEAIMHADVIIDLCAHHFAYSDTFEEVIRRKKARISALAGRNAYGMIKTFKGLNLPKTLEVGNKLIEFITKAKTVTVKSKSGTNLTAEHGDPSKRLLFQKAPGIGKVGYVTAAGQLAWSPIEETINGVVSLDALYKFGICNTPVKCTIKEGNIVKIEGGLEAQSFSKYLASFNDPGLYTVAHYACGFNPGMPVVEFLPPAEFMPFLQRIFGSFGIGYGTKTPVLGEKPRKSAIHTDSALYHPSIWLDDMQIEEDGRYIHPEIVSICKELKVPGY